MTSVKITDLTAYTDAASTDVLPIVDVGADVTKKIAISDIVKAVPQGTAALPGLAFDGDPNTGLFSAGADQVGLATNGTGRLFIDSAGRITAGTANSTHGSTLIQNYYSFPDIINVIGAQYSSAATAICYAVRPKSGSLGYESAAGNYSLPKGVIELDGNCAFKFASAATVPIGTTVSLTEVARVTTTGITFNGDTAAANALDDYEEGTWTPSVGGNATYLIREGRYTKIGRLVHVSFYFTVTTVGTGSSTDISGLPFTPLADTGGSSLSYWTGLDSSVCTLIGYIYGSATTIYLYSNTGAATLIQQNSVIKNSSTFQGHLSYFTS